MQVLCVELAAVPNLGPMTDPLALFEATHFAVCRGLLDIEFFHNPKRQRGMNT
jgi:hypothetical protein